MAGGGQYHFAARALRALRTHCRLRAQLVLAMTAVARMLTKHFKPRTTHLQSLTFPLLPQRHGHLAS